ncbi:MAG: LysM peptidoglycan-binding domain-containing protein [Candidatus Moranbacteria bacterium]|nr:LysM peptidoglycan-binding domain-containing protein [Candidatus Moranbacteria bacterium]
MLVAFALLLTLFIGLQDARAGGIYVVRKGDTMSKLFGTAYRKVAAENGIKDPDRIRIGQRIAVPEGIASRVGKSIADGFIVKTVKGDFRWHPGADKLRRFPEKGSAAVRLLLPGISDDVAAILWAQLTGSPTNGTFEKNSDGSLVAVLADSARTRIDLSSSTMIGGKKAIRYSGNLKLADVLKVRELTAMSADGKWLIHPKVCGNLLHGHGGEIPPVPVVPPASPVESPQASLPSISVFPSKEGCELEYELIAGAGVWKNDAAQGHFYFGEGMLYSCDLGNGVSVGAGFYGYGGSGESGTGYSWDEGGLGPQVGIKRNFLASHHDEFGQEVLYPAGWQLKLRYLPNDYVEGRSDSYHVKQWGRKYGFYGEYWQRTSESALYGVSAEAWWYDATRFSSSWSGDSPQDRGSQAASVFAQYRLSDDWQFRLIGRIFHQNWDNVTFAQVIPEFRYDESLMISPWVSRAIINGNGAGPTIGLSLRYEHWGKLREKFERDGRNSVKYLGTVSEVSGSKPDTTIGTKVTEQQTLPNAEDSLRVVPDSVCTEAVSIFAE